MPPTSRAVVLLLLLLLQALRPMPWQRRHPRPVTTRQRLPPQPVPGPVRLLALAIDFLSTDITDCHTP
jgi:hypothetical protein